MRIATLIAVGLIPAAAVPPPRPLSGALAGGLQPAAPQPLAQQGLAAPGARLPPPRSTGDAAPLCRAQCATSRAACGAGDDDQCAERWSQCVSACARSGS